MRITVLTFVLTSLAMGAASPACLRPTPDKRAIQWSDAIVHAKLQLVAARGAGGEEYKMQVVAVLEGKLKQGEEFTATHGYPPPKQGQCAGPLTSDDVDKSYLVLLRAMANDKGWQVVTISPLDPADTTGSEAVKQLVAETRKAEAALTDDQVKAQALALANAEDDTEAQQAEDTLMDMGPKALRVLKPMMDSVTAAGARRLTRVVQDLTPPG